jgi:hypothetical protein
MTKDIQQILTAIKSLRASQSCFSSEAELNHQYRFQIESLLFQVLESKYMNKLTDYWNETDIPLESEKAIVFVERRCHPNLEFCIKNAVYFARGYSLYIFCSEANRPFVEHICGSQKDSIHIIPIFKTIGTPQEGKDVYNKLLKDESFWKSILSEDCLMMETDTYLRGPLPDSITQYDYVASKWPWLPNEPGGGGLSFRKRSMMIQLCQDETLQSIQMQDSFVSDGVKKYGYTTPSDEDSKEYFTECELNLNVCGVHQWWTFVNSLSETMIETIVACYTELYI